MNIVGLDLSLTATGVAYADGSLRTLTSKATGMERLNDLRNEILLSTRCVAEADLVVIEGYAFGRPNQATHLGELGGVVRLALYENGIPYVDVPPASLKKFACGKGNATKPDMRMALFVRAGIDERDDNRVDAAWLRLMALDAYGDPRALTMPALNRKALEVIEWPEIKENVA